MKSREIVSSGVPQMVKLRKIFKLSDTHPEILAPEKVDHMRGVIAGVGAILRDKMRGQNIHLGTFEDYFAFAVTYLRDSDVIGYFDEFRAKYPFGDFERCLMHISKSVISDLDIAPFSLIAIILYMAEVSTHGTIPALNNILEAKILGNIQMGQVHKILRSDSILGITLIMNHHFGGVKWPIVRLVFEMFPQFDEMFRLAKAANKHVVDLAGRNAVFLAQYHTLDVHQIEYPEDVALIPSCQTVLEGENQSFIVTIPRHVTPNIVSDFRGLLSTHELFCYDGFVNKLTRRGYHYLWLSMILEDPTLVGKIQKYPLCEEMRLVRELLYPETRNSKNDTYQSEMKEWQSFLATILENRSSATVREGVADKTSTIIRSPKRDRPKRSIFSHQPMSVTAALSEVPPTAENNSIDPGIELGTAGIDFVSGGKDKQIIGVELNGFICPEGVSWKLERKTPHQSEFQEMPKGDDAELILIEPLIGKNNSGEYLYRLVFTPPKDMTFTRGKGEIILERKVKAICDPTPEEKEEDDRLREARFRENRNTVPASSSITLDRPTLPPIHDEAPQDIIGESLIAAAIVLYEHRHKYAKTVIPDAKGVITIVISDADGKEAQAVINDHRRWGIDEFGNVSPTIEDPDIQGILGNISQDIRKRAEEQKEQEIYNQQSDTLRPYLELFRDLAGTEGLSLETSGATLNRAFREAKLDVRVEVERYEKGKPSSQNILTLRFNAEKVVATFIPSAGVRFSGEGYEKHSQGIMRAYEDFVEVMTALGDFIFLNTAQKEVRLRKIKKQRSELITAFIKNLQGGNAQFVILCDSQIVPSYLSDDQSHVGFPSVSCPPPEFIPITAQNMRTSYDTLRQRIHGDKGEHKELSVVCLVRKGHLHMDGDPGDTERHDSKTVERNIDRLSQSPQGRILLWDRILATKAGGSATPIKNGSFQILDTVLSENFSNILPTDESKIQQFIDMYLDALKKGGILLTYVRFSAVTLREVETALRV